MELLLIDGQGWPTAARMLGQSLQIRVSPATPIYFNDTAS